MLKKKNTLEVVQGPGGLPPVPSPDTGGYS